MHIELPIDKLIHDDLRAQGRACDFAGCKHVGTYKAPKSREQLREYWWFCLDHVRMYNQSWNFYAGMSEDEFQSSQDMASRWERPTWPLGGNIKPEHISNFRDKLDLLQRAGILSQKMREPQPVFPPHSEESKSLLILDLEWPVTLVCLKKKYKELAKKFHPDLNKNDKFAEEKLKRIISAYGVLKKAIAAL